jgi:hypothetical protein
MSAWAMPDAALHALGVLAHGPVGGVGQPDHVEQLVDAALARRASSWKSFP